jgi:hypothetical protein
MRGLSTNYSVAVLAAILTAVLDELGFQSQAVSWLIVLVISFKGCFMMVFHDMFHDA